MVKLSKSKLVSKCSTLYTVDMLMMKPSLKLPMVQLAILRNINRQYRTKPNLDKLPTIYAELAFPDYYYKFFRKFFREFFRMYFLIIIINFSSAFKDSLFGNICKLIALVSAIFKDSRIDFQL